MGNSIFLSFELNRPDRTYDRVARTIRSVDDRGTELHYGHWHVSTALSARQVADRLKPVFDESDKLIVIDATHRQAAWLNLGPAAIKSLEEQGY